MILLSKTISQNAGWAGNHVGREPSRQASTSAGNQASREAGKQGSKQASKQVNHLPVLVEHDSVPAVHQLVRRPSGAALGRRPRRPQLGLLRVRRLSPVHAERTIPAQLLQDASRDATKNNTHTHTHGRWRWNIEEPVTERSDRHHEDGTGSERGGEGGGGASIFCSSEMLLSEWRGSCSVCDRPGKTWVAQRCYGKKKAPRKIQVRKTLQPFCRYKTQSCRTIKSKHVQPPKAHHPLLVQGGLNHNFQKT